MGGSADDAGQGLARWPWQTIVVTGATGSFGRALVTHLCREAPQVTLRCLARNEHNMVALKDALGAPDNVRYFLGDIRDQERLQLAFRGADLVVHAAAYKQVDLGEYDPLEFSEVNINGTRNVIRAAIAQDVRQVLLISSDKAVQPLNLYGATKQVAERLTIQANAYSTRTRFNAVRYGNVFGSNGSVLHVYRRCLAEGTRLPLTHPDMTRFYMTLAAAVDLVCWTVSQPGLKGGLVIPVLPAYHQLDLAKAMMQIYDARDAVEVTGIRPGEKLAETLMTDDERARCYTWTDRSNRVERFLVRPAVQSWARVWTPPLGWAECTEWQHGAYSSDTWPYRLTADDLLTRLQDYTGEGDHAAIARGE